MNTGILLIVAAGFFLLRGQSGGGSGPRLPLSDGTFIGPGGVITDSSGRVVRHGTAAQYAQAIARRGAQTGQPVQDTLAQIKSVVGIGTGLYQSISSLFGSTGVTSASSTSTAEILRDRIAAGDPAIVADVDAVPVTPETYWEAPAEAAPIDLAAEPIGWGIAPLDTSLPDLTPPPIDLGLEPSVWGAPEPFQAP